MSADTSASKLSTCNSSITSIDGQEWRNCMATFLRETKSPLDAGDGNKKTLYALLGVIMEVEIVQKRPVGVVFGTWSSWSSNCNPFNSLYMIISRYLKECHVCRAAVVPFFSVTRQRHVSHTFQAQEPPGDLSQTRPVWDCHRTADQLGWCQGSMGRHTWHTWSVWV